MWMIHCSTVEDCHDLAALNDEGDWVILLLVIASVAASFVCIAVELPTLQSPQHSLVLGIFITGLTVALSWTFTHTVFTLHYANVYYRPDEDGPGGLIFPGHREPDYRDFLYYSFVIGCASQTADVATVSRAMRHLTMVHGIVSFAFNTAVLALTINVGASLLMLTMPRNRLVDLIALAFFVALCLGIGALGASVVATSVDTWYADLAKPSFTPPDRAVRPGLDGRSTC